jgi:hypothetical protein
VPNQSLAAGTLERVKMLSLKGRAQVFAQDVALGGTLLALKKGWLLSSNLNVPPRAEISPRF